MSEKVVYILGAGFSAPLGLPVMGNFLSKAKDLHFRNPDTYSYFREVFDEIDRMSKVKNYYSSDLFNIEEILSLLEMRATVTEGLVRQEFIKFITDVVEAYTPDFSSDVEKLPTNFEDHLFGQKLTKLYCWFVSAIGGLTLHMDSDIEYYEITAEPTTDYSVITLNYDLVLEKACEQINRLAPCDQRVSFKIGPDCNDAKLPVLAKLHGSISGTDIVPPTWNKSLHSGISKAWSHAYRELAAANYIRILGYSLPESDSYVKYLLKSAVIETTHLKQIDVICLDELGDVQSRYRDFIEYPGIRFVNGRVERYLDLCLSPSRKVRSVQWYKALESKHNEYMRSQQQS